MSYMADRDHIAITSGDASTTRRKVSVPGCPVTPPITVTQGDSSDTYRRIAPDSEILPGNNSPGAPGSSVRQLEFSERAPPAVCAHIHGGGEFALAPGRSVDGGTDLGHRLVTAERVVAEQVHEPAVIKLHERVRVEFLEPAADLGQLGLRPASGSQAASS